MSNEKIESLMRRFVEALTRGDVEKGLSLLAEDAVYDTPSGTFRGKQELRRYLTWVAQSNRDLTVKDSGVGIMVQGNTAVFEHVIGATVKGRRWETLALCVYEFKDDKIQRLRTVYDRLTVAKQAATGWFPQRAVSSIVRSMEKGLH